MQLVKISSLFHVKYGVNLELVHLEKCNKDHDNAIRFVSRTEYNNGISAYVIKEQWKPNPQHTISVAGGGSVLSSFYQEKEYLSGRDIYYLTPINEMSVDEMIYYAMCLKANKYKYNYGRQANKTLKDILVPPFAPKFISTLKIEVPVDFSNSANKANMQLNMESWQPFKYSKLFKIVRGRGARIIDIDKNGSTPFVTATDQNNGWSGFVNNKAAHNSNVITVTRNGSVGEAFYQPTPFASTEDVHVFNPLFDLNPFIALFILTVIKKEKYRFNYGRKWGLDRMNISTVLLPVKNGEPDFDFMEKYIKSLPYSGSI